MIDLDEMHRRITSTKWDIFPLDRLLPLATVHRIFADEFKKQKNKEVFVKGGKYQRLREAYFALFVGVSLNRRGGVDHLMRLPSKDDNDIDFVSKKETVGKREEFWRLVCDVKEFTSYSESFENFIKNTIEPRIKRNDYHIILGLHSTIQGKDLEKIRQLNDETSTVWVVSNPSEEEKNYSNMLVTWLQGDKLVFQDKIDLLEDVPLTDGPLIIYQDLLRDKIV